MRLIGCDVCGFLRMCCVCYELLLLLCRRCVCVLRVVLYWHACFHIVCVVWYLMCNVIMNYVCVWLRSVVVLCSCMCCINRLCCVCVFEFGLCVGVNVCVDVYVLLCYL